MKKIIISVITFQLFSLLVFGKDGFKSTQVFANIVTIQNECCNGDNVGKIVVSASGGNMPYTYMWSPSGGTKDTAIGLTVGTYTVVVTDALGNTATASSSVTEPTLLIAVSMGSTNNTTCVNPTGTASVMAAGGTPPYTYLWTISRQTNATATGLAAGNYICWVKDNNCCTASCIDSVGGTSGIIITLFTAPDTNSCDGSASASVTGGIPPFTYLWSHGGQTTQIITGLCAGTYCCKVKDNSGCQDTACAMVDTSLVIVKCPCGNATPSGIAHLNSQSFPVQVYPNPANSILNVTVSGIKGQADFYLTDVLGRNVLTLSRQSVASGPVQLNIESLHSGVYFLTIESNGQRVEKKVTKL